MKCAVPVRIIVTDDIYLATSLLLERSAIDHIVKDPVAHLASPSTISVTSSSSLEHCITLSTSFQASHVP